MKRKKDLTNLTPEEQKIRQKKINRISTIIVFAMVLIVFGGMLYYAR